MKLSIVIPCYNMASYLPFCLDSILDQKVESTSFEIIIINDGSKDNTLQIAYNYATSYENIYIIDKKNQGVGAARNSGLDAAKGEFIYFIDPDDLLVKDVIDMLISKIEENEVDLLTFNSFGFTGSPNRNQTFEITDPKEIIVLDGISYIARYNFKNEIWWYIINRNFLLNSGVRFLEGRWMEDAIFTAQLFSKAAKICHTEIDAHRYRILPNSAMRNRSPDHYKKIIYDNAHAAKVFVDLIHAIPKSHKLSKKCSQRLSTRQQSFVFFLLVRLMKSDLSLSAIPSFLNDFKSARAFPLNNFLGEDYNGFKYRFLVYVFNRKMLLVPFMRFYRVIFNYSK